MMLISRSIGSIAPALVAAGLLLVSSAHAQGLGTITLSCPSTAPTGKPVRASVIFVLPPGSKLARHPAVRVSQGEKTWILLPTSVKELLPAGRGSVDFDSRFLRAGAYTVKAELQYRDALGSAHQAFSDPVTLTIP